VLLALFLDSSHVVEKALREPLHLCIHDLPSAVAQWKEVDASIFRSQSIGKCLAF